ncbi:hypothetical protein [Mycolicibacterium sp. 050158]|uniref:hypothetical protein n=1 Tax=Mycolicibacterium sp. 050158 TaxID=3090602 RepID=UPI00299E34D2|nr:hypothetical protein [Mycolicibacterium sp. 050158]MDX1888961.1 hypothetical protein [Mycolicibacterium sp. 050158]
MERSVLVGQMVGAVAPRLGAGGASAAGAGGIAHWVLPLASLLAVFAVGGAAARVARRLTRRSAPELLALLDRSADFYSRWPEDRLAAAPRGELVTEEARCRRIVELLGSSGGPASRGPIDGLQAWMTLLRQGIGNHPSTPTGPVYA